MMMPSARKRSDSGHSEARDAIATVLDPFPVVCTGNRKITYSLSLSPSISSSPHSTHQQLGDCLVQGQHIGRDQTQWHGLRGGQQLLL